MLEHYQYLLDAMMTINRLLSDVESAEKVHVSTETLHRYAECGFLKPIENDGGVFYDEFELCSVFGLSGSTTMGGKVAKSMLAPKTHVGDSRSSGFAGATNMQPQSKMPVVTRHEDATVLRRLREEVRILKEERNWLRERLEKLEARSEREQMLRLAEVETLRNLVEQKHSKRGLFNFALPWLKQVGGGAQ